MKKNKIHYFAIIVLTILALAACKTKETTTKTSSKTASKESFISLYRSGCYGSCPSYKVTINADGSFLYFGKSNVANLGSHIGNIENATKFFEELETVKWKSYPDKYPIDNVDFAQFSLEYSNKNTTKKIQANSNAAKELIDLAQKIDALIKDVELEKLN